MTHGLIIGKFYPPHVGHHHLIETAAAQVDTLTVLVMASERETIPLASRVGWLGAIHPHVTVLGSPCDIPLDLGSETVWTAQVALMKAALAYGGRPPVDVVFSSEGYGAELARRFDATHVAVDPSRACHPVSGSAVRADLAGQWDALHPVVQAGLTARVVVLGPESTGTTTVARALADSYRLRGGVWARTAWVPEYGRDYTISKLDRAPSRSLEELVWDAADFAKVAAEQNRLESKAALHSSPLLVCDTDALATTVWERRYVGPSSRGADPAAAELHGRRIYLLTDHVGVPFVQDGWRDGEHIRAEMTGWFVEALTAAGASWALLTGTLEERLHLARLVVGEALLTGAAFGEPLGEASLVS